MESSEGKMMERQIIPFNGIWPQIHESVFLAEGARLIGDIVIGENSSVWYNCVIRADVNYVRIGRDTNIQDGSILHETGKTAPLVIGNGVTIGHKACLHGCTIHDYSLIGMGAIVLDKAVVEMNAMVAAGAVVRPGFIVPSGKLVAGIPAKVVRDLTAEEIAFFKTSAEHYSSFAQKYKREL